MRLKPLTVIRVVLVVTAVAACGGSGDDAAVETTTSATVEAAPATTEVTVTTGASATAAAPDTTEAPVAIGEWMSIRPDDCECSDGSPFELWQRPADPTRVLLYLEGGGACFNAETCSPASPIFTKNLELGQAPGGNGIFDADNPENPFADYSIVYVPYCTGDVHLGDRINEYTDTLTISHTGFDNASSGLDTVIADYPDVEHLVVAGSSAGSIPAPTFAGLAADALPDAEIVAFGDASGAYPDLPELNARVGSEWGVLANVPDWPVNEGLTAEQYSFPGLYVQAGTEHPDITFARFDNAFDGVQTFFSGLLDVDVSNLLDMIDATEDQIETAGVPIASFIAPGGGHTILGSNELYDLEVEEVRLVDFLGALVAGDVPDDVRCTVCS